MAVSNIGMPQRSIVLGSETPLLDSSIPFLGPLSLTFEKDLSASKKIRWIPDNTDYLRNKDYLFDNKDYLFENYLQIPAGLSNFQTLVEGTPSQSLFI